MSKLRKQWQEDIAAKEKMEQDRKAYAILAYFTKFTRLSYFNLMFIVLRSNELY
jgi:hypothetical protein